MEFKQVIMRRRTIRDFSDQELDINVIKEAINDAFLAPTYDHLKQWYFLIIDDFEQKVKLTQTEEMYETISEEMKVLFKDHDPIAQKMYFDAIPKQKRMILEASLSIVVIYKPKTDIKDAIRVYDINGFASIWCAIENLLLSLAEKNIFGVTFIPKNTEAVKEILGIPNEFEIASIIPIGYKKDRIKEIPQKELDINQHILTNRWK